MSVFLSLAALFSGAACTAKPESGSPPETSARPEARCSAAKTGSAAQTGWTEAVPPAYHRIAQRKGSVERLDYAAKDYAGSGGDVRKTAYVYLPWGYDAADASKRYDIIYLMHGWGGSAGEFFALGNLKNTFDRMIENGDMKPVIMVSATFYHSGSDREFGGSVRELRAFHEDFENDLMPAVEGKYHTYAKSASPEDLKASRNHRAFGGFSLGSVTSWLELCYDFDYIRYFAPMSGSCWYCGGYGDFRTQENVDYIEKLVKENDLDARGYFIYHTTGTNDAVRSQSLLQAEEMLKRKDVFTPEHYVFYQKKGGNHDFEAVEEYLYNALPLFFPAGEAKAVRKSDSYTRDTRISEVIGDPAFGNFGRLLFPADSSFYGGDRLGNLRLLWYSGINPDKTVEIVNSLKKRAEAGEKVFYNIYSEAERAADPSKADTGLFFFRGGQGAKYAVCCAGGGMVYVGAMHDSFPHALELSKKGYNAFALIYRPGFDTAMADLARAVAFITDHADELGVDPQGYSLWGGSAGARIAAAVGNADGLAYYGGRDDLPRAAAVVMQYTGYGAVSPADAPTFACCGTSDVIADWRIMEKRLKTLTGRYGIPTEFRVYKGLPHGFGLGEGTAAEGWLDGAEAFWKVHQ